MLHTGEAIASKIPTNKKSKVPSQLGGARSGLSFCSIDCKSSRDRALKESANVDGAVDFKALKPRRMMDKPQL